MLGDKRSECKVLVDIFGEEVVVVRPREQHRLTLEHGRDVGKNGVFCWPVLVRELSVCAGRRVPGRCTERGDERLLDESESGVVGGKLRGREGAAVEDGGCVWDGTGEEGDGVGAES